MKKWAFLFLFIFIPLSCMKNARASEDKKEMLIIGSKSIIDLDGNLNSLEWKDAYKINFTSADGKGNVEIYLKYTPLIEEFNIAFKADDETEVMSENRHKDGMIFVFDTLKNEGNMPQNDDFFFNILRGTVDFTEFPDSDFYYGKGNGSKWDKSTLISNPSSLPYPFGVIRWSRKSYGSFWQAEISITVEQAIDVGFTLYQVDMDDAASYDLQQKKTSRPEFMREVNGSVPSTWDILHLVKSKLTYSLQILSKYSSVSGDGSYEEGSTVSFSVSPSTVSESRGIRYVFTGWTSGSPGGYSGTDNPASVVLNDDVIETAEWDTQYLLTIDSPVDVEGGGWYDEDERVMLRTESPGGFPVRRVFKGWSDDIQSESETVFIVMDGPKTVVAEWRTDYTQLYILGGLASAIVVSAGALSLQRRRAERRRRARAELKKALVEELRQTEAAVQISSFARTHGAPEELVRQIIDEALKEGAIEGWFTKDEKVFVVDTVLKREIRDKLKEG